MKNTLYCTSIHRSIRHLRIITIFAFILFACNESNQEETAAQVELRTRYTFSQEKPIDFTVAGGTYQVIYDYSVPFDTIFTYSGAFEYGHDSVIYAQVRRTKADFEDEGFDLDPEYYHGEVTALILYDGSNQRRLQLPDFHPYFSAFLVEGNKLYYWGFSEQFDVYAYQYELDSKKIKRAKLDLDMGTDYFGHVDPPVTDANGLIHFRTENGKKWRFNTNFELIRDQPKKPTYFAPDK